MTVRGDNLTVVLSCVISLCELKSAFKMGFLCRQELLKLAFVVCCKVNPSGDGQLILGAKVNRFEFHSSYSSKLWFIPYPNSQSLSITNILSDFLVLKVTGRLFRCNNSVFCFVVILIHKQ